MPRGEKGVRAFTFHIKASTWSKMVVFHFCMDKMCKQCVMGASLTFSFSIQGLLVFAFCKKNVRETVLNELGIVGNHFSTEEVSVTVRGHSLPLRILKSIGHLSR